jgi:hypothetical protein
MMSQAMMMRGTLLMGIVALIVGTAAWAQKPAGATPDAEAARSAFRKANDAARQRFLKAIDGRIADAKKAGDLGAVEEFAAQKDEFAARGTLPAAPGLQAAVREYQSDRRIAARLLVTVLKSAEEAATKADRLDEARKLRAERAEAEAANASEHPIQRDADPAELIQTGAVWAGYAKVVRKNPEMVKKGVRDMGIRIRITSRDGDSFKGVYRVDGGDLAVEIDGWLGKSSQSRNGTWRDVTFQFSKILNGRRVPVGPASAHNGQIRGGVWKGTMPAMRQGQGVVASAFELSPAQP